MRPNASIFFPVAMLVLCLIAFSIHFHRTQFTCDDAYISFRYSHNIVDGLGPVFNAGERVEGYTNPLWVYLLACGELVGVREEHLAQMIGFVTGVGGIVLSFLLARAIAGNTWWVLITPLFLVGSRDYAAWSSSGLEMGFFVSLLLGAVYAALRERDSRARPLSAVVAVLAILTRPEGVVIGLVVGLCGIFTLKDRGLRFGIMALLLAPVFVFRIGYYHELIPNTVAAKGGVEPLRGLFYLAEFFRVHPGIPVWALLAFLFRRHLRWIGLLGAVQVLILIIIGGDFMEFRLAVPLLALAACCVPYFLKRQRAWLAWSLVLISVFGYWFSSVAGYRQKASRYMIENVGELRRNARQWSRIGKFMNTAMQSHELVAVGPAGAIPYYSKLPTLDMLGLCDTWVARHGKTASSAAGHGKAAPREYLEQRGVVWVVGYPDVREQIDRRPDRISVQLPWGHYLSLGTTLDADSLRMVLRQRGFPVAVPDTSGMSMEADRAVEQLIKGWQRLGEGDFATSLRFAQTAQRRARRLGMEWRWLLREAGVLEQEARKRIGEPARESKRWNSIDGEVPTKWRNRLGEAKENAFSAHLDSAEESE